MAKKVESIAGGENGVANVSPMVFTVASPWQVVGFSKANDVAMFYKAALGVEKICCEQWHVLPGDRRSGSCSRGSCGGRHNFRRRDAVNTTIKVGGKLQIGEIEEEISEKKKERWCEGVIPLPESPIPNGGRLFQQLLGSVLGLRKVQQQGEMAVLLQVQVWVPLGIERMDFASWEDCKSLIKKINASDPWGQGSHKGGSNVVTQLCTGDEGVMAKKKKKN